MKRTLAFAVVLLVSAAALAQQENVPTSPAPRLDDASVTENVYTNNFFGFRYTLPEGFKAASMPGWMPGRLGIFRMFAATRPARPEASDAILVTAHSPAYTDDEEAHAYLRRFTEAYQYYETAQLPVERFYAGRKFFMLSGKQPFSRVATLFTPWRGYILSFQFEAPTDEGIETLLPSLDTLNFFGPDTPLPAATPDPPENHRYEPPSWSSGAEPGAGCSMFVTDSSARRVPVRVRVSQGVADGMVDNKVAPVYPPLARQARIQGSVVLAAVIGCDGAMQSLSVLSGHPMLVPAAMDAVKQWRYKPYILNGQPVEVETKVTVNFVLKAP